MDLSETLFQKVYTKIRRLREPRLSAHAVFLKDLGIRLQMLSYAIAGRELKLQACQEGAGGFSRDRLVLPARIDHFESQEKNTNLYLFRAAFGAFYSGLNAADQSYRTTLEVLKDSMPGLYRLGTELSLEFDSDSRILLFGQKLTNLEDLAIPEAQSFDNGAEREQKGVTAETEINIEDDVKILEMDQKKVEEWCLQHHFEKIETAEEFNGNWRLPDGEDELEEHAQALDEIKFDAMVRLDTPVHAITNSTMRFGTSFFEEDLQEDASYNFRYSEWSHKQQKYLRNHCVLREVIAESGQGHNSVDLKQKERLIRLLKRIHNKHRIVPHQYDGQSLDLNSVLDFLTDRKAGRCPEERIFCSDMRKETDLSVTLLLDLSLSTDAWIQNQRILDLILSAAHLSGEVLTSCQIDFEIAGFRSHTRKNCSYVLVHEREQNFYENLGKLHSLQAQGYTRMGPSIRHASARLGHTTGKKAILLITDAKPGDYDPYEGWHGIYDVHKAFQEARKEGINLHLISMDSSSLPQIDIMLNRSEYSLVRNPSHIPDALFNWLSKLL